MAFLANTANIILLARIHKRYTKDCVYFGMYFELVYPAHVAAHIAGLRLLRNKPKHGPHDRNTQTDSTSMRAHGNPLSFRMGFECKKKRVNQQLKPT